MTVKVIVVRKSLSEPPIQVVLAQGSQKAESLELVIQKATELGVSRVVPLITDRTVARPKDDKLDSRLKRWKRIALEAAKQSQRARVPVVDKPLDLIGFLETVPRDALCLIPWEMEKNVGIKEILDWEVKNGFSRTVAVLIGPEGGFSEQEVDEARKAGAIPVSMGPRILHGDCWDYGNGNNSIELGDLGGAAGA